MGIDHIIAILILKQSSSALLCSRRLFVGSLFICLFIGPRFVTGTILRLWSQCLWAVLEHNTREAVV